MRFFSAIPLDRSLELSATELRVARATGGTSTSALPTTAFARGEPRDLLALRPLLARGLERRGGGVLVSSSSEYIALWSSILRDHGVKRVVALPHAVLAARGAGLPVSAPEGLLVLDAGHTHFEVSLLASGAVWSAVRVGAGVGGLLEELRAHFTVTFGVHLSQTTAISLLFESGVAPNTGERMVSGREERGGHPVSVPVELAAVMRALPTLRAWAEATRQVLRSATPALSADLLDSGGALVGGGALIPGMEDYLSRASELSVRAPRDPRHATLRGAAALLADPEALATLTGGELGALQAE